MSNNANTSDVTEYALISGTYAPEEAMEIISHLIQKKISFHELRNFSKQIRTGMDDTLSIKRIDELKQSQELLKKLVREAIRDNKSMKVSSTITINLV